MKKSLLVLAMILGSFLFAFGAPEKIVLSGGSAHPGRDGLPLYFDMPDAYYNYCIKTQEILIDGHGVVNYYDVEITSPVTNAVEISTQVDGSYDTIDISSLAPGLHVITIESPSGNIYEGTF